MKFIFISIICLQIVFASDLKISRTENQGYYYSYSDPVYYSYTPITYTYTPSTYYYTVDPYTTYSTVSYPSTYRSTLLWRKKESEEPKTNDLQQELVNLKKEVYGKEDFSMDNIRKEGKAYDSRWLIAQLKITRILELEDSLKKQQSGLAEQIIDEKNTTQSHVQFNSTNLQHLERKSNNKLRSNNNVSLQNSKLNVQNRQNFKNETTFIPALNNNQILPQQKPQIENIKNFATELIIPDNKGTQPQAQSKHQKFKNESVVPSHNKTISYSENKPQPHITKNSNESFNLGHNNTLASKP